jgi:hypothetical protein
VRCDYYAIATGKTIINNFQKALLAVIMSHHHFVWEIQIDVLTLEPFEEKDSE